MARSPARTHAGPFAVGGVFMLLLASAAVQAQPYTWERAMGIQGTGPGQFQQLSDIDQDSHGHYIVLDLTAGEYQVCTNVGVCTEHDTLAKANSQQGQQFALAVNSKNEIFITSGFGTVEKCAHDGGCEAFIDNYMGQNVYAWGIAIDAQDRVYISDLNFSRIIVCNSTGTSCSDFGSYGGEVGQFYNPYGLAIDHNNRLLVLDSGNQRIQSCDHQGQCRVEGYSSQDYYGGNNTYIDTQASGLLISSTLYNQKVSACTLRGACRTIAAYDYSTGGSVLQIPYGVLVDADGRVVVADYGAIHFFAPNVTINPGINDAWVEAGIGGQGMLVTVFEGIPLLFIAWFTYESTRPAGLPPAVIGEWGHRWITLQGSFEDNVAQLDIYLTQGGVFDSAPPSPGPAMKIGEATFTLHDCYNATLDYNITSTGHQGSKNLVRLSPDNVPNCQMLSGDY